MNMLDSELVLGQLCTMGYDPVDDYKDAVQRGCPALLEYIGGKMELESFGRMLELYGFDHEVDLRLSAGEPQVALEFDPSDPSAEFIGQGTLTVTPIQIARAFATLISPSQVPELKLIRAIHGVEGDRQVEPDHQAGEPAHASEIQRFIWGALWDDPREAYAASGNALAGPAKDLGWFMGAQIYENTIPVIVVIVEGESSTTAQRIGLELLKEVE